jgi:hypothetical protein
VAVVTDTGQTGLARGFALLRRLRYPVYLGGLAVVVVASTAAPAAVRPPLVALSLCVMCTTYLAELHGRADGMRAEAAVTAVAVAGVAVGAYLLATTTNHLGGALFVLGGVLFFRAVVRGTDD